MSMEYKVIDNMLENGVHKAPGSMQMQCKQKRDCR